MDKSAFGMRSPRRSPTFPTNSASIISLSEAAKPIYEADRHAKKDLKAFVRDIRPVERLMEGVLTNQQEITPAYMRGLSEEEAHIVQDYCLAVRSALTDDGQPPLCAAGLRLQERLTKIGASLQQALVAGYMNQPVLHLSHPFTNPTRGVMRPCSKAGQLLGGRQCQEIQLSQIDKHLIEGLLSQNGNEISSRLLLELQSSLATHELITGTRDTANSPP